MNTHPVVENEGVERKLAPNSTFTVARSLSPVVGQNSLFQDILLESTGGQHKRRTWATLFSFLTEGVLPGVLVLIPLWFTDVLPKQQLLTFLEAPPPPPPPPPAAPVATAVRVLGSVIGASSSLIICTLAGILPGGKPVGHLRVSKGLLIYRKHTSGAILRSSDV